MKKAIFSLLLFVGLGTLGIAEEGSSERTLTPTQLRTIQAGIDSAFRVPSGYVLTPDMMPALTRVRNNYEPQLRQQLTKMQFAETSAEKTEIAKSIQQIRAQIGYEAGPVFEAKRQEILRKQQEEMQKKLEAARKAMEQRKKKNQGKHNKNGKKHR